MRRWLLILLISPIAGQENCPAIPSVGNPINAVSDYVSSVLSQFSPTSGEAGPRIVSVTEFKGADRFSRYFLLFFEVKIEASGTKTFVGVEASTPADGGPSAYIRIEKYLSSPDFLDLRTLFNVPERLTEQGINCRETKRIFSEHFFQKNQWVVEEAAARKATS